jgi:TonB family protein
VKAVGDIVLGSDYGASRHARAPDPDFFAAVRHLLAGGDVVIGNLETPLTTAATPTKDLSRPGNFVFRSPPGHASMLRAAGFKALNVANNHAFDFGDQGYGDTLASLEAAGIAAVGGKDEIRVLDTGLGRVALVGFSYAPHRPFNYVGDKASLSALVARARQSAGIAIVVFHAGAEGPRALRVRDGEESFLGEWRGNAVEFGRAAVDAGAHLVIGVGPHVLRGVECYRGRLIAYSLGNFVAYGALSVDGAAEVSMILDVALTPRGELAGVDLVPLRFDGRGLPQPDPEAWARFLVHELSRLPPLAGVGVLPQGYEQLPGYAGYSNWIRRVDIASFLEHGRGELRAAAQALERAEGAGQQLSVLAQRYLALERQVRLLEAQVAERLEYYRVRPRKAFVGGRTAEAPFADYVSAVRERVAAAQGARLPAAAPNALVSVTIAGDGAVRALELDRSSGSAAVDLRLSEAVRRVAPFPPLPDAIRDRADLLVITFQFPDP